MSQANNTNQHQEHDSGYKQIFSHPWLVRDLLLGFVKYDWVQELDYETLEPYTETRITDDYRGKYNDCVWRLRFRGEWLYLYLFLEFQSSEDYFMSVRFLTYVGLLYQDIIKSEKLGKGDKLPPIMPLLIYNGTKAWQAPTEVSRLIDPVHPVLRRFTPQLQYFLLDEGRVPSNELETGATNLVAELIKLEMTHPKELRLQVSALAHVIADPKYAEIRRTFAIWLKRLIRRRYPDMEVPEIDEITEESSAMLAERLDMWLKEKRDEGVRIGEMRGLLAGIQRIRSLKYQTIRKLVQRSAPINDIADLVDMPAEKVKQVIDAGEAGIDLIEVDESELRG
ncbi:Rpn family recombination-promoting nuclease/putative transposase [Chrysiogenes arsenatis]|uniref:Rpn family recombination-promoting nuclease/putative transposase n=1 Tax=Chrysiogenes arsenatis TaxID=309797 RepID=UPI00135F196A|nr:Rpn family recombination-promoting nuclease/putative transposase [Chrysiogenes arsenatis]